MTDSDKQVQLFAVCILTVCVPAIGSLLGGWRGFKEAAVLVLCFWSTVAILTIIELRRKRK